MKTIVHQITEIVFNGFKENIKELLEEGKDISEFILKTEEDLNKVGLILTKEALSQTNQLIRESAERKEAITSISRQKN